MSIHEPAETAAPEIQTGIARVVQRLKLMNYSSKTIKSYRRHLLTFFRAAVLAPEKVRTEDISLYLETLSRTTGLSRSTAVQLISALKHYYKCNYPRRTPPPTEGVPIPRRSRKYPDILSRHEVQRILTTPRNIKHRFLLTVIYSGGLRVSEAVGLRITDLDHDRKLIHIRQSKNKKDRFVMLSSTVASMLSTYRKEVMIHSWLFPGRTPHTHLTIRSAQAVFDRACEDAEIGKNATIHSLRHAFATHLLEDGVDLRYIQELLGHASSRTTEIYTHVCKTGIRRIPSPLDKLPV